MPFCCSVADVVCVSWCMVLVERFQTLKVKVLGSPYPQAVAGKLGKWAFKFHDGVASNGTGSLEVVYTVNSTASDAEDALATSIHVGVPALHCHNATTPPTNGKRVADKEGSNSFGSCVLHTVATPATSLSTSLGLSAAGNIVAQINHTAGYSGEIDLFVQYV